MKEQRQMSICVCTTISSFQIVIRTNLHNDILLDFIKFIHSFFFPNLEKYWEEEERNQQAMNKGKQIEGQEKKIT